MFRLFRNGCDDMEAATILDFGDRQLDLFDAFDAPAVVIVAPLADVLLKSTARSRTGKGCGNNSTSYLTKGARRRPRAIGKVNDINYIPWSTAFYVTTAEGERAEREFGHLIRRAT
jgi:hypothetical protein